MTRTREVARGVASSTTTALAVPAYKAYNKEASTYEEVGAKRGQPLREGFWIVKVRCVHDAPRIHISLLETSHRLLG